MATKTMTIKLISYDTWNLYMQNDSNEVIVV
jgi:hypothetical protein